MTQLTVTDLENAKKDVDTIAGIANSTSETVEDRLGNTRYTLHYYLTSIVPAIFPNFASIIRTSKRLIFVETDETNGNEPTLYFDDGTNLNWIPMVGV